MKISFYTEGHICSNGHEQPIFVSNESCLKCGEVYTDNTEGYEEEYECELPSRKEVCPCCNGEGKTYLGWHASEQPAFTREDFYDEGPEFEEDYFAGRYDAQCPECKGLRVIDVLDCHDSEGNILATLPEEKRKALEEYEDYQRSMAECDAISAMERRMGA